MKYFEDKDSIHTLESIKSLEKKSFKKLKKNVHSNIFTKSTFWYKFKVENSTNKNTERYFVFDLPWIDKINIFILNNNKTTKYSIGNQLNFKNRSQKVNLLNQKHIFKEGFSTVYMQVKTRDPFVLPVSLLSKDSFNQKIFNIHTIEFAIYCTIFSMLFFNFLLYFVIRNQIYIYYVLFLSSFLFMSFSYNNFTFQYILNDTPNMQNWLQSIGIFIFSIFGLLFSKSFLNLKEEHPRVNILTKYIIYFYILLLISPFVVSYDIHIMLSIYLVVLFSFYILTISIYSFIKGNKSALFFIVGTIFGLMGTTITALSVISILPYEWYLYKAVDFGIIIDSILLSVALANRYNILYSTLQKTEKKLLELNETLEDKVKQRTNELSFQLKNKNILLKEISHRVKNNLQIVSALFSMDKKKISDKKAQEVINNNIQRIKSISLLYENFIDSKDLENIDMNEYINSITKEFQLTLENKVITYNVNVIDTKLQSKELIPLGLIINELITNSIKYAFLNKKQPEISITIRQISKNEFKLTYKDNGLGTNIDTIKKGFGFKLLKSLAVYQLNGTIECSNNKGLEHIITFQINE